MTEPVDRVTGPIEEPRPLKIRGAGLSSPISISFPADSDSELGFCSLFFFFFFFFFFFVVAAQRVAADSTAVWFTPCGSSAACFSSMAASRSGESSNPNARFVLGGMVVTSCSVRPQFSHTILIPAFLAAGMAVERRREAARLPALEGEWPREGERKKFWRSIIRRAVRGGERMMVEVEVEMVREVEGGGGGK